MTKKSNTCIKFVHAYQDTCTTVGKILTIKFHLCAKTNVFKVEVVVIHGMIASCFENAPRSFHVKMQLVSAPMECAIDGQYETKIILKLNYLPFY